MKLRWHSSVVQLLALCLALLLSAVSSHVLECYVCSSVTNKAEHIEDLMKDPCWDPVKNNLTLKQCPDGHTCHKHIIKFLAMEHDNSVLTERFSTISRYCGSVGFVNKCTVRQGVLSVDTSCSCTADGCNSASMTLPFGFSAAVGVVLSASFLFVF